MNRRAFLKFLFAAGVATAVDIDKAIEQTLIDTVNMSDAEFVAYINVSINLYVTNPAACAIITDIEEP